MLILNQSNHNGKGEYMNRWEHVYEYMKFQFYELDKIPTVEEVRHQFQSFDAETILLGITEFKMMMKEVNGITVT